MKERKKQSRYLRKIFASLLVLTLVAATMLYSDGMYPGDEAYAETVSGQVTLTSSLETLDNTTTDKVAFTVNVGANATEGVSGIQFEVSYPTEFDLVSYEAGGFFDNGVSFFGETKEDESGAITWAKNPFFCGLGSHEDGDGANAERVKKTSGKLVTLIFEANTTLDTNKSYSFGLADGTTEAFLLAADKDSNPNTTYYNVVATDVAKAYAPDKKTSTQEPVTDETVKVRPTTSESGTTTATVKKQAVEQAIAQAKTDTSKTEVVIDASTDTTSAPGVAQSELTLAKESMQAVANANKAIRIKTDTGQLTFSPKAAESIGKADGGERLVIETEKKDTVTIGSEAKAAAVFTVTAKLVNNSADASSAGTPVTSFGGGVVTVALDLPGSLQQLEDKRAIRCWHYDLEKKNYSTVNGEVSADGKQYVFTTTHFSDYIVATEDTLETFEKENTLSGGITVRGTVTSYNPGNATTVQLKQSEEVKYATTIAAASGSGQVTQNFSLANVPAGTYDLVVTKPGHLTYTIKNVVVGSEDIDLTAATKKAYQTITLLAGDVNGDGSITEDDVSVIRYSTNINKATTSAADKLADVNGDGSVTEDDVSVVRYSTHINKGTANCTYQF